MKALSLTQPWATAIMLGIKKIETRSWKTNYRGPIAIHAAKGFPAWAKEFSQMERALVGRLPARLPLGAILGVVVIEDVVPTEFLIGKLSGLEHLYGDYSPGRWGWKLGSIKRLTDENLIPCKGALGLWVVPPELERILNAQL